MVLKEKIVLKYNKLLREIMANYDLHRTIMVPSTGMRFPQSLHWDEVTTSEIKKSMELIRNEYPHLESFYKIFISTYSNSYEGVFIKDYIFKEINVIIKKTRKEKSAKENKS